MIAYNINDIPGLKEAIRDENEKELKKIANDIADEDFINLDIFLKSLLPIEIIMRNRILNYILMLMNKK